jgi:hypothetical protein
MLLPLSMPTPQLHTSHPRYHLCLPLAAVIAEYTERGKLRHHLGLLSREAEGEELRTSIPDLVDARCLWLNLQLSFIPTH